MKTGILVSAFLFAAYLTGAQETISTEVPVSTTASMEQQAATPQSDATKIPWVYDLQLARDKAKINNKLVLVYFYTAENNKCQILENQVFTDPRVISELNNLIPMKANFATNTKLAYQLWLFGAGTFAISTADGNILLRRDVDNQIDSVEGLLSFIEEMKNKLTTDAAKTSGTLKSVDAETSEAAPAAAPTSAPADPVSPDALAPTPVSPAPATTASETPAAAPTAPQEPLP